MHKFRQGFISGNWLTKDRMLAWCVLLLIAFVCVLGGLYLGGRNNLDALGRPLGTDFSCFYAAGQLALHHQPLAAYQFVPLHQQMTEIFGSHAPYYGWYYPPLMLIPMMALATLPYPLALTLWLGLTFLLYLFAMAKLARTALPEGQTNRKIFWLLVVAFPAVFLNICDGQNGFLSAGLLALALTWLKPRPIAAGICFGLMAYKPQFCLLIPFVLAISRNWRAWISAAITAFLTLLPPTLLFGAKIWPAFFHALKFSRELELEQGGPGFQKVRSLFAAVRHLGGDVDVAYVLHGALAMLIFVLIIALWRRRSRMHICYAAFLLASLLISPHSMNYDLMVLAPVFILMYAEGGETGFAPGEKSLMAALWLIPVVATLIAGNLFLPLAVILMLSAFFLLLRKARRTGIG